MKLGDFLALIFTVIPYLLFLLVYDNFGMSGRWWQVWTIYKIKGGRKVSGTRKEMGLDK